MYLKSLTLRGFKSFASATTLRFEPGITAVVGPNGSGKSNVVDAIAWVLGEQGAKSLRGGKMEDVIFAGTADRPPLGRAEVTLTIDNSDGALPIEYSEVGITRRMFRDGASEYEINGSSCRLLDIQELLSDSGIGREMHVIVGQGQLDAVLTARPEDRRAFIEEAAGVLKHRKRREKALRKLDAMQVNLTRLNDLTGELRRQLKPLGRQAEVARRALSIQAELRDARLRLLADDLAGLQREVAGGEAEEAAALAHRERVSAALAEATATQDAAAAALAVAAPALHDAEQTWFALSALTERFRGTLNLALERQRHLASPVDMPTATRDPADLDAAADAADEAQHAKRAAVEAATADLAAAVGRREACETELRAAEQALVAANRAIADRREGLARLHGQVSAARSRLAAIGDEIGRLDASVAAAQERAAQARTAFDELQGSSGSLGDVEVGLDEAHEAARQAADDAAAALVELVERQRDARGKQASLISRVDALRLSLARRDGSAALLAGEGPVVLGSLAGLLEVADGAQVAVAAALGAAADAVAVAGPDEAVAVLEWLRTTDAGRAGLVVAGGAAGGPRPLLPAGAAWAADLVVAPEALRTAIDALIGDVVVVDDLPAARVLLSERTNLRAVTRGGDLLGAHWAAGGSSGAPSTLEVQAAVDESQAELDEVTALLVRLDVELSIVRERAEAAERGAAQALQALHDSDAQLSAVAEELGRFAEAARSAASEAQRLQDQREQAEQSRERQQQTLAELTERLTAAQAVGTAEPAVADTSGRDTLLAEAGRVRQVEMDARLALRTAEERARATAGTADGLRRAARTERETRARAETAERRRAAHAALAGQVVDRARVTVDRVAESLVRATAIRDSVATERAAAQERVSDSARRVAEFGAEWDRITSEVHREELVRAQQAVRLEQLTEKATTEFAITVEDLLAEFGPEAPTPPTPVEIAEYEAARARGEQVYAPQPMPFDRPATERRLRAAERDLGVLGKVNPLALEEFAALEERHAYLSTQLADLKDTRRDLLTVVDEVDRKILEVFTGAYHDVAREFEVVFRTLFPGGEGELVLTDPSNMLTTGIEVHARPPGKKIRRLSLLSGGERSLTAVAMLVAIFRARPSPFYVMDEVEAALDEVNLTRLVGLLDELRTSSQLIVITHQKLTMEAADALYGVSMRGDGITQVISQRIRGLVGAAPTG